MSQQRVGGSFFQYVTCLICQDLFEKNNEIGLEKDNDTSSS